MPPRQATISAARQRSHQHLGIEYCAGNRVEEEPFGSGAAWYRMKTELSGCLHRLRVVRCLNSFPEFPGKFTGSAAVSNLTFWKNNRAFGYRYIFVATFFVVLCGSDNLT
jgi:hypothetical protein